MTKYVKYIIVNMFIHTSLNGDITSRYAYVLGTIQMFVFGGGGLQLLMCLTFSAVAFFGRSELHAKGVFEALKHQLRGHASPEGAAPMSNLFVFLRLRKMVGAEMTRRTFTNCCHLANLCPLGLFLREPLRQHHASTQLHGRMEALEGPAKRR